MKRKEEGKEGKVKGVTHASLPCDSVSLHSLHSTTGNWNGMVCVLFVFILIQLNSRFILTPFYSIVI